MLSFPGRVGVTLLLLEAGWEISAPGLWTTKSVLHQSRQEEIISPPEGSQAVCRPKNSERTCAFWSSTPCMNTFSSLNSRRVDNEVWSKNWWIMLRFTWRFTPEIYCFECPSLPWYLPHNPVQLRPEIKHEWLLEANDHHWFSTKKNTESGFIIKTKLMASGDSNQIQTA